MTGVTEAGGVAEDSIVDLRFLPGWDARLRWVLVEVGVTFDADDSAAFFAVRAGSELITGQLVLYRASGTDRRRMFCPAPPGWDGLGEIAVNEAQIVNGPFGVKTTTNWAIDGTKYLHHTWRGYSPAEWREVHGARGGCP